MDTAVQTFEPTPEPSPRPSSASPRLRTLLLTDLVDSTGLVERLGDAPASDLFRAHDRLVLQLQQQWHGRLIDRSDGMLLLFERPIDGLGFALDYARGLIALGDERGLELRARAGLHVGEVLTWRNSEEAVSVGAKPVEVEGLAKPMAARLMATARPGQILLSSVAEPLAHRAARELGERGQHLAWKSWGRWRFKGVPEPQQVFEVGEPGVAPLRMPPDTPKAWRDIPLWRRPGALAAEAALLAGLVAGAWFVARPEPAIAFNQRDWVVVGDLRNLTGQAALDDSLQQAFRISLEQSRYVNVLSDLKARDTLGRMRRAPDTKLDRAIASEIALRDGARAVILPTVAEVGGRVRVSAEVIDPRTQTTVYTETADGTGVASTLDSIDTVTASLRGKLGEAVKSIEKDSVPLPQVTTKNLDALRAYALGQKAYSRGQASEALQFYRRATGLDPQFALAWIGQVRSLYAMVDAPAALEPLRRAQTLRNRLAPREALYLDAWAAEFDAPRKALQKWTELATLYPDFWPGSGNAAIALYGENRFREALPYAERNNSARYELATHAHDLVGRIRLGMEEYDASAKAFDKALALGYTPALRRRAAVDAARRNFKAAQALMHKAADDRYVSLEKTSMALDRAQWRLADTEASSALRSVSGEKGYDNRLFLMPAAVTAWFSGDKRQALEYADNAAAKAIDALAQPYDANAVDDAALAIGAALFARRLGDPTVPSRVRDALRAHSDLMQLPALKELEAVLDAEVLRAAGQAKDAVALLKPFLDGSEKFQTRVALQEAYADAGEAGNALEQARWLESHRGLAYIEFECGHCLQAMNVTDSNIAGLREAELLVQLQRPAEARKALQDFSRAWPAETLPEQLRMRYSALAEASN